MAARDGHGSHRSALGARDRSEAVLSRRPPHRAGGGAPAGRGRGLHPPPGERGRPRERPGRDHRHHPGGPLLGVRLRPADDAAAGAPRARGRPLRRRLRAHAGHRPLARHAVHVPVSAHPRRAGERIRARARAGHAGRGPRGHALRPHRHDRGRPRAGRRRPRQPLHPRLQHQDADHRRSLRDAGRCDPAGRGGRRGVRVQIQKTFLARRFLWV